MGKVPNLKFCSEGDMMYPKCIPEEKTLVLYCEKCGEFLNCTPPEFCVHVEDRIRQVKGNALASSAMAVDHTLPITRGVECPQCGACQAVYQAKLSSRGMMIHYQCHNCLFSWSKDCTAPLAVTLA